MEIKCIGKKKTMLNSWFLYKMLIDKKEYLIENIFHNMKIFLYNDLNEFEEVSKRDLYFDTIETELKNVKKNDTELNDETLLNHFTITEVKSIIPVIMKNKIFTDAEINLLFEYVSQWTPVTFGHNMYDNFIETELEYYSDLTHSKIQNIKQHCANIISTLEGYTATMKVKGDHKNDGQLVDYKMILKSPSGEKTTIETEMCLMDGFNYYGTQNETKIM